MLNSGPPRLLSWFQKGPFAREKTAWKNFLSARTKNVGFSFPFEKVTNSGAARN